MAGSKQVADWLRQWQRNGNPDGWQLQFAHLPGSSKVTCLTCGRSGYSWLNTPAPWQVSCLRGHAHTCGCCLAPVQNLGSHEDCKLGHRACGQHHDGQYRRLVRAVEAL